MMARNRIARFTLGAVMFSVLMACAMRAQQAVTQGDERNDPNLPGLMSPPGLRIQWSQPQPGYPSVTLTDPDGPVSSHAVQYLGWNDQGSYFRNYDDRQVYVWNLKKNSLTKIGPEVPPETLATLKNNRYAVAKNTTPPPPKPKAPEPQVPDTSRQAAFFGGSGKLPDTAVTTPGAITGSGAAVEAGVLTFTKPDKSKATYKVVRPKVMQNNPQAAGIAGAWIAVEANGSGIIFTVQADGTLTGREVPAQVIQMLTQAPAR